MALEDIKGKIGAVVGGTSEKAAEVGRKVAHSAKAGAKAAAEKTREVQLAQRMSRYNPVFPEQYCSAEERFDLPRMVIIEDEDRRKGIDVCEGAVGWLTTHKDKFEVFHIYDEFVEQSGLRFMPARKVDAAYFEHPFESRMFVEVGCYLEETQKEKAAELGHVAYMLGAKYCKIEIVESESSSSKRSESAKAAAKKQGVKAEVSQSSDSSASSSIMRSIALEQEFEGSDTPQRPVLKWFANDSQVNGLIERVMMGDFSKTKHFVLTIRCSDSSSMSTAMAGKIDSALGPTALKGGFSFSSEVKRESGRTMVCQIDF